MPFTGYNYTPYYAFIQPMCLGFNSGINNFSCSSLPFATFAPFTPSFNPFTSYTYNPVQTVLTNDTLSAYSKPEFSAAEQITTNSKVSSKTNEKQNDVFAGYNSQAGKTLAEYALNNSHEPHNQCSGHVNRAIQAANLGIATNADAYEMIDVLNQNSNFKSIPKDTDIKKLPAGCIVVYDKGVAGYSDDFGHIEIAYGDGRGISDGITDEIKPNPSAIYMPV